MFYYLVYSVGLNHTLQPNITVKLILRSVRFFKKNSTNPSKSFLAKNKNIPSKLYCLQKDFLPVCVCSEGVPSLPVAVLPGNFVPLRCKPPFCNPFLHNLAFGVDVEPGDDALVDLGMDFPVPLGPAGVGVRMPLSGELSTFT